MGNKGSQKEGSKCGGASCNLRIGEVKAAGITNSKSPHLHIKRLTQATLYSVSKTRTISNRKKTNEQTKRTNKKDTQKGGKGMVRTEAVIH